MRCSVRNLEVAWLIANVKRFQGPDQTLFGLVVNVAIDVGNRSGRCVLFLCSYVNVDTPEMCRSTVLAYARLHPNQNAHIYQFQCQPPNFFDMSLN